MKHVERLYAKHSRQILSERIDLYELDEKFHRVVYSVYGVDTAYVDIKNEQTHLIDADALYKIFMNETAHQAKLFKPVH